jgi:Flp pilus assembly protein TadD
MSRSFLLLLAALFFVRCSQQVINSAHVTHPETAIPVIRVATDTGSSNLRLSAMKVSVVVTGNLARTTFDLTFFNPMDRVLEGELDFPLADGQTICRYALEVNEKLREGVVVEKTKARVAFENTIRQGIDPGLVEKTKGNHFRTRIYPIPAKGYKHLVIGIEQALSFSGDAFVYQLPLYTKDVIGDFSLRAKVANPTRSPDLKNNELPDFNFRTDRDDYLGEISKKNFEPMHLFTFAIPVDRTAKQVVFTETKDGRTWFYVTSFFNNNGKTKTKPASVCVLWDISASADRDRTKELDLLHAYLKKVKDVKIVLVPFHITPLPAENFTISDGIATGLLGHLKNLQHDGGTQLGALDLRQYGADEFLLFSDGISTFGKKEIIPGTKPVHAINAAPSADHAYLKFLANKTGGHYLDLNKMELERSADLLGSQWMQLMQVSYNKDEVEELITTTDLSSGSVSLAGILKKNTELSLGFGYDAERITERQTISIHKKEASDVKRASSIKMHTNNAEGIGRIWASMWVDQLEMQFEKNRDQVTALGKEFSIVTKNTSLLVLDRVEDYVRYKILPPKELQKEYFDLLQAEKGNESEEKTIALNEALTAMEQLKAWWNHPPKRTATDDQSGVDSLNASTFTPSGASSNALMPGQVLLDSIVEGEMAQESADQSSVRYFSTANGEQAQSLSNGIAPAPAPIGNLEPLMNKEASDVSEINIVRWHSNEAYLRELQKVDAANRLHQYFKLKKQYGHQPYFFADAAKFFFEKNDLFNAMRILSNIAEMKMENAELLRDMAYQLMEMKETSLAIETFKEVLAIREEEPHSYRDLALAYNEWGRYNEAVSMLYKLITGTWDTRFGEIRAIAINEMNAIISAHPGAVDLSNIDKRMVYAMPVDVRIVIGWSADNSDIDLWVTDPNKEKCFYSDPITSSGAKMTNDVTQGYGPEEYSLKRAPDGTYTVEVNLFGNTRQTNGGPITIKADLFTDFGRPGQKKETIHFRVTEQKEVVTIGKMKFNR